MTRPSIDQTYLSPSGRVSKRARKAAQERVRRELFGDGLPRPGLPAPPSERDALLRQAAELRELAARGFRPIAHIRHAELLEARAKELAP